MNVLGYSERGVLYALWHEIATRGPLADDLLHALIAQVAFPFTNSHLPAGNVQILPEQSFSDFGEADALILIDGQPDRPCSIFVEAKVKTLQYTNWLITDEWAEFEFGLRRRMNSSNLFAQLYHKLQLVEALRKGGIRVVEQGVQFPHWSSKQLRKIGGNEVVLEAARLLLPRVKETFFAMIVPDQADRMQAFFDQTLRNAVLPSVPLWVVTYFGYITWAQIRAFCQVNDLHRTLAVLDFNGEQIYGP